MEHTIIAPVRECYTNLTLDEERALYGICHADVVGPMPRYLASDSKPRYLAVAPVHTIIDSASI